jgi:hypothetical protein
VLRVPLFSGEEGGEEEEADEEKMTCISCDLCRLTHTICYMLFIHILH